MFLQLKGQLLDKLFTKGGWGVAGFLLFGTLHSALMQWLLEWESKEERYSVRELRRYIYIYIYFFTFHFCFFDCTRVAHQGLQMALRGLVALQFLFLILYMCVYINMYPTYAYGFIHVWVRVGLSTLKASKKEWKACPVNSVS